MLRQSHLKESREEFNNEPTESVKRFQFPSSQKAYLPVVKHPLEFRTFNGYSTLKMKINRLFGVVKNEKSNADVTAI